MILETFCLPGNPLKVRLIFLPKNKQRGKNATTNPSLRQKNIGFQERPSCGLCDDERYLEGTLSTNFGENLSSS